MRRFLTGFVVAAIAAVVPALALAGNQEVAEQIASKLRNSGQMSDYKIGVKYQDGTAWLRGRVASEEQMKTALTAGVPDSRRRPRGQRVVGRGRPKSSEPLQLQRRFAGGRNCRCDRAASQRPIGHVGRAIGRADGRSMAMPTAFPVRTPRRRSAGRPTSDAGSRRRLTPQTQADAAASRAADRGDDATVHAGPTAPDGAPLPMYTAAARGGAAPARYDQPACPTTLGQAMPLIRTTPT